MAPKVTDPRFFRAAKAAAKELDADAVVVIAFNKGSPPHIAGCDIERFGASKNIADDLAQHLLHKVVPQWLMSRDYGKPLRRKP